MRPWKLQLCLALASIVIFVLTGEGYLRLQSRDYDNPSSPMVWQNGIGYLFKPGEFYQGSNHTDWWVKTKINSLGYLDREPESPDGSREKGRVVVIGDSFVQASQVNVEDKFHVLLEHIVNSNNSSHTIRTWAFGKDGTGQIHQLAYYDRHAHLFSPHLVVLVLVGNDISNNSPVVESIYRRWHPFHQPFLTAWFAEGARPQLRQPDPNWASFLLEEAPQNQGNRLLQMIYGKSYLWRYLATALSSYFSMPREFFSGAPSPALDQYNYHFQQILRMPELAFRLKGQEPPTVATVENSWFMLNIPDPVGPAFEDALSLTDFALSEWKKRAEADGFSLLALLSESTMGYCIGKYKEHPQRERWMSMLEKYDIPHEEVCDTIVAQNGSAKEARFAFDGHWNKQGHIWAAETIKQYLDKHPELFPMGNAGSPLTSLSY